MRNYLLALTLFAAVACGGEAKKPALSADDVAKTADTAAPKEDMPPPPAKEATDTATKPASDTAATPAAGGAITVAPFKIVPAKKGAKTLELKQDGTLVSDGKTVATIKGDQVNDPTGSTLVTVGVDGSLVGNNVKPGWWKFSGDELVGEDGSKMTVGDDGALNVTKKDGKTESLGKLEGGSTAKRAALIGTVIFWMSATEKPAAPPAKKPADKPAAKPAKK